jgi:hypothetical protein
MRWIANALLKLRLTAPLRGLGIRVPWLLKEIEQEWFGGVSLSWDAEEVEEAFDVATRIRGLKWVLGNVIDRRPFAQFPDIGRRGGYQEFLRVYWFGIRMASVIGATRANDLIARVIAGDADASEEATAIHLLRSRNRGRDLEIEPHVKVGERDKNPDFRIRQGHERWVYGEVTRLHRSDSSSRVQGLLARIVDGIMVMERPFLLEIMLNREPVAEEEQGIVSSALAACDAANGNRINVADVASILVKAGDPRVAVPSLTPEDRQPRMAISRAVVGPGRPNRQLIARVPFADQRAEDILHREARQLPRNECGLVMVNVNAEPTAFESWSERVPERFKGGQLTRVAGVILFMHATTAGERGLIWAPYVRLISNPRAAVPLPAWITQTVTGIRENTRRRTGGYD